MTAISIKIDTDDLMRIIGDDPETRLKITSSITQQFADRYLKAVVNTDAIRLTEAVLREAIKQQVKETVGTISWSNGTSIQPEIKSEIKRLVASGVRQEIDEMISAALEEHQSCVPAKVEAYVNKLYEVEVKQQVQAKVKEIVDAAYSGSSS